MQAPSPPCVENSELNAVLQNNRFDIKPLKGFLTR